MKPHVPGRWHAQGLDAQDSSGSRFSTGADVVRHLGAVQSQLHDMALWALGRRCGRTFAELRAEFDELSFRRTHVLRPTWHYAHLDDLPWLQQASAHRVERLAVNGLKPLGISVDEVDRAVGAIGDVVADGRPHVRDDLRDAVVDAGLNVSGNAMAHYAMVAEVRMLIANGPMVGKQHTYLALPRLTSGLSDDDVLTELAIRYGRGHGAFRAKDLAWWSSLTLTQARRAIDLADLAHTRIDGEDYALPPDAVDETPPPAAALLSNFDEYISYARDTTDYDGIAGTLRSAPPPSRSLRSPGTTAQDVMRSMGLLFVDGALGGLWRRTVRSPDVVVEVIPDTPLSTRAQRAVEVDAERFARFLGKHLELTVNTA